MALVTIQYSKNSYDYDKRFDVLNLHFRDSDNSIGKEEIDDIIEFIDLDTKELTGLTIMNFIRMFEKKDSRIQMLIQKYNFEEIYLAITKKRKRIIK